MDLFFVRSLSVDDTYMYENLLNTPVCNMRVLKCERKGNHTENESCCIIIFMLRYYMFQLEAHAITLEFTVKAIYKRIHFGAYQFNVSF